MLPVYLTDVLSLFENLQESFGNLLPRHLGLCVVDRPVRAEIVFPEDDDHPITRTDPDGGLLEDRIMVQALAAEDERSGPGSAAELRLGSIQKGYNAPAFEADRLEEVVRVVIAMADVKYDVLNHGRYCKGNR